MALLIHHAAIYKKSNVLGHSEHLDDPRDIAEALRKFAADDGQRELVLIIDSSVNRCGGSVCFIADGEKVGVLVNLTGEKVESDCNLTKEIV